MGAVADIVKGRFVISTGDNFYPNGVTGIADPLWRMAYEDVYTAASLRCPWYPVLGNHDHRGNVDAQIQYGAISDRWRMPARCSHGAARRSCECRLAIAKATVSLSFRRGDDGVEAVISKMEGETQLIEHANHNRG